MTEGEKTEPRYIIEFQRVFRAANVKVEPTGFDPKGVVEKAIEIKRTAHRGAKPRIWAVFDRDEHTRFNEATKLAQQNGIAVASSNPCFELWAVFHYQDHAAPIDRHQCQRLLEKLCDSYRPNRGKLFNDPEVIRAHHDNAVERGARSLSDRAREGRPHGNPSTSMHLLMGSIRTQGDS